MSQQEQAQESGKVGRKFEENLKKVIALVGGPKPLSGKKRIPKTVASTLVDELLKEKIATAGVEFKTELGGIIEKKIAYDKLIAEEEKKFAKFKEDKQAEFNKACESLLNKIEGIDELVSDYTNALGQVASAAEGQG